MKKKSLSPSCGININNTQKNKVFFLLVKEKKDIITIIISGYSLFFFFFKDDDAGGGSKKKQQQYDFQIGRLFFFIASIYLSTVLQQESSKMHL